MAVCELWHFQNVAGHAMPHPVAGAGYCNPLPVGRWKVPVRAGVACADTFTLANDAVFAVEWSHLVKNPEDGLKQRNIDDLAFARLLSNAQGKKATQRPVEP